jgi:hypothetical protein
MPAVTLTGPELELAWVKVTVPAPTLVREPAPEIALETVKSVPAPAVNWRLAPEATLTVLVPRLEEELTERVPALTAMAPEPEFPPVM